MDRETISQTIKNALRNTKNDADIFKALQNTVRSLAKTIGPEQTQLLLMHLRNWHVFIKDKPHAHNIFEMRHYIQKFAQETLGNTKSRIKLFSVSINHLSHNGRLFKEWVADMVDPKVLTDENTAIYGGVARAALKLHAHVCAKAEFPFSDFDLITKITPDIEKRVAAYRGDLAGTKTVMGDMFTEIENVLSSKVDCTMNQVAIYNGKLYFTEAAYADVKTGIIRLVVKNDPLFGSESIMLPDGNMYLSKNGFYRTLSYLLREKGSQFVVSKENIEEKYQSLERYWIILLTVKLLQMPDGFKKDLAINNWFLIAKKLGSTTTTTPDAFLKELMSGEKGSEMTHLFKKRPGGAKNHRIGWLVEKLVDTIIERTVTTEPNVYPTSFTPVTIARETKLLQYNLAPFWKYVAELSA